MGPELLVWYQANARDLPWRRTRDPWAILVSEVLLQQTRVEQARGYFERILARFPTPGHLAEAGLEELLRLWQGAGYYRRAARLFFAARRIAAEGFPRDFEGLLALPGVGRYTAGAVASIAFGEPVPAVDGNARRVLARYFAVERPSEAWLWEVAARHLDRERPGAWNQALIELGATVCRPRRPLCSLCPLREGCRGRAAPERYPRPRPRRVRIWRVYVLLLLGRGGWVLELREEGPWAGLYAPPLGEDKEALLRRFGLSPSDVRRLGEMTFALTHRRVEAELLFARGGWPGTDPGAVPLSTFARRVLELAEQRLAEEEAG